VTGIWPGTGLAPIPEDELAVVGGALHGGSAHQGRAQRVRLGLKKPGGAPGFGHHRIGYRSLVRGGGAAQASLAKLTTCNVSVQA